MDRKGFSLAGLILGTSLVAQPANPNIQPKEEKNVISFLLLTISPVFSVVHESKPRPFRFCPGRYPDSTWYYFFSFLNNFPEAHSGERLIFHPLVLPMLPAGSKKMTPSISERLFSNP